MRAGVRRRIYFTKGITCLTHRDGKSRDIAGRQLSLLHSGRLLLLLLLLLLLPPLLLLLLPPLLLLATRFPV